MLLIRPATASEARPSWLTSGARSASLLLMRTATGPPFEGGATCGWARSVSSRRRGNQDRHGCRTSSRLSPYRLPRDRNADLDRAWMNLDSHLLDLVTRAAVQFAGQRPVEPDLEFLAPGDLD